MDSGCSFGSYSLLPNIHPLTALVFRGPLLIFSSISPFLKENGAHLVSLDIKLVGVSGEASIFRMETRNYTDGLTDAQMSVYGRSILN